MVEPSVVVVVPVHDNAPTLDELHRRLEDTLDHRWDWRTIYIDDASTDTSWRWVEAKVECDPRAAGLRTRHNVGQTRAVVAALSMVSAGQRVVTIDADLDYPPECLADMVRALDDADVVLGRRSDLGATPVGRRLTSTLFNLTLRVGMGYRHGDVGCGVIAIRGEVARHAADYGAERRAALRPLLASLGNRVSSHPVPYRGQPGQHGPRRRAAIALDVLATHRRPIAIGTFATVAGLVTARATRRRLPLCLALGAALPTALLIAAHRRHMVQGTGDIAELADAIGWLADIAGTPDPNG